MSGTRSRWRQWWPWLGVLVLAGPAIWPALAEGVYVGNGTDLYSYQLPMRRALRAMLLAGEWPTWNPWILGGVPLLAGMQLGVLYPPNLVAVALPPEQALEWLRAVHALWLGAGGVVLSNAARGRRLRDADLAGLVTAAVLLGAGQTWGHIYSGHVSFVQAWAWTPWIWAAALVTLRDGRARDAGLTGAALALQLLAGHPQVSYLSGVGLVVLLVATVAATPRPLPWRGAGLLLAAVPLALLLAAAQLWPTAELAPLLNRSLANADTLPLAFSAKPVTLATVVAWDAFGGVGPRLTRFSYHETLAHLGAVALALGLLGLSLNRRGWVLALGVALFVALSPGRHGPAMPALLGALPGLELFRVPARWLLPATGLLALGAGLAVAQLRDAQTKTRWPMLLPLVAAAVAAIALASTVDVEGGWWRDAIARPERTDAAGLKQLAASAVDRLWLAALAALAVAAVAGLPKLRPLGVPALVALVALEGLRFAAAHVDERRHWPAARVDWSPQLAQGLRQAQAGGRLSTSPRLRHANWGGGHGLPVAGGYETAVPLWTNRFINLSERRHVDRYAVNLQLRRPSPWLNRLAGKVHLRHSRERAFADWPVAARSEGLVLQRNPAALPRVHFARQLEVEPDRGRALRRLGQLPRNTTLVAEPMAPPGPAVGTVQRVRSQANWVDVEVDTPSPQVLVVRDVLLPGWEAEVDGVPAHVVLADGLFRAVALPKGARRVHFRYRAPGLRAGLATSAAAWLLLLLGLAWRGGWLARLRSGDASRGGKKTEAEA